MFEVGDLERLLEIMREGGVVGVLITGALIILVRDWRVTLLALLGQYVMVGIVLLQLTSPEIALIKVLVGALICLMLYLAARQSGWGVLSRADVALVTSSGDSISNERDPLPWISIAFRALVMSLVFVLALQLGRDYPLPDVPPDVGLGCYWLMLVGLMVLMLTEWPLLAGPGLLTALTGFELFYTPLESSLIVTFLLAMVNLLLAVAISYLAAVQGLNPLREGSRD